MRNYHLNHYELAFGNWLIDNRIQYIAVDEQKRAAFGRSKIKSFDYLITLNGQQIIAEVKGRKFKGTSFAKLSGFECWVTADDIDGLAEWQAVFGAGYSSAFIFAYRVENIDVDFDGREVYEFRDNKYIFFCIRLDDYLRYMKIRSPKWKTVTLPAAKFRKCAVQMQSL
ncbi:MAG: HYExAFE family protein [Planctomycetota bacterium]